MSRCKLTRFYHYQPQPLPDPTVQTKQSTPLLYYQNLPNSSLNLPPHMLHNIHKSQSPALFNTMVFSQQGSNTTMMRWPDKQMR